ncbi:hypothetical protein [Erythrobacter sp. MTPC3]|uniref:hypothetical protein n=1 Tax=Erythrobacter sp. MTPC3 TaxID=3056564 RepID=UPI0036F3A52B
MLFFGVVLIVALLAVADPLDSASISHRSIGGLILGPLAFAYAFRGFVRGEFPELSQASRSKNEFQFWFCFVVFTFMGIAMTVLGVRAFLEL